MAFTNAETALSAFSARLEANLARKNLHQLLAYQKAWLGTYSLSEAASLGLSKGHSPEFLVSQMQKDCLYLASPPRSLIAIETARPAPEIGIADLTAHTNIDQEDEEDIKTRLFLQRYGILRDARGRLGAIVAREAARRQDLIGATGHEKTASEMELRELQVFARILTEQSAFRRAVKDRDPDQTAQISDVEKMITAGLAALLDFDTRLARNEPLAQICAEDMTQTTKLPPTEAQKRAVDQRMTPKPKGPRLVS